MLVSVDRSIAYGYVTSASGGLPIRPAIPDLPCKEGGGPPSGLRPKEGRRSVAPNASPRYPTITGAHLVREQGGGSVVPGRSARSPTAISLPRRPRRTSTREAPRVVQRLPSPGQRHRPYRRELADSALTHALSAVEGGLPPGEGRSSPTPGDASLRGIGSKGSRRRRHRVSGEG